jgi:hypothetical protein
MLIHGAQNVSMAGVAFNLILIRVGKERNSARNVRGYSQNTAPLSALQFSPTTASSQAQTFDSDTACQEKELGIAPKVESEKD